MATMMCVTVVVFSLSLGVECGAYRVLSALRTGPWQYEIVEALRVDGILIASFNNTINETGWSFLEIRDNRGNRDVSDLEIAYIAGKLEANLTASLMEQQWLNTMSNYCTDNPQLCEKLVDFVLENSAYVGGDRNTSDPRWYQIMLFNLQVSGLADGYLELGLKQLPNYSFKFFQLFGDIDDLASAFTRANFSSGGDDHRMPGSGSCSALIKLLPDNSDLLVGHDTWSHFSQMLRIFKLYDLKFHTSSSNETVIPGYVQAFSSYPGRLFSGDDFYLLSSGLVAMETTIENSNPDLWKLITPKCVLENVRVVVANRLATSGKEWTDCFKEENSGTYNNQWMIVDYQKFVKGEKPQAGLLWVLEQMPNLTVAADQTDMLIKNSYWASYNIPFYKDIYDISGTGSLAKQYGDFFTWDGAPRAKIFARDHSKVTDLPSFMNLMKYNNFKHDKLAACKCKPPYSGENAIAARSDLNPPDGTYPFSALGHRLHGAIDMKVTNSLLFSQQLSCHASSGPTSTQQPPFQWTTSSSPTVPLGHPDLWNFDQVRVSWIY